MDNLPGAVSVPARRGWLLALWGLNALLVARFFYVCDDALISLRYARNWAGGHGLRYNLVESPPVEGYSNFLWVALAAIFELIGIEALYVLPVISVLCGWLVLYRVWSLLGGLSERAAVLGVAFLALSPAMALWSSSGLETMPTALLLLLAVEQLVLSPGRRAGLLGGLAALSVGLIRAEGFVWALLLVGCAAVQPGRRRQAAEAAGIVLVGLSLALAGRLWWFGQWMPNTVTAKVGFSGAALLRGLRYFGAVHLTLLTPPLALLGAGAMIRWRGLAAGGAVAALAAAGLAWPVAVGGDFMPMGRLFVVVLPLLALLWGAGLSAARRPVWIGATALMVAGALSSADIHVVPEALRARLNYHYGHPYRSELAQWVIERDQVAVLTDVGVALARATPPGATVVVGALGAVGYYSGRTMIDRFGLITPRIARRVIAPDALTRPGHDKAVDSFYFIDDDPPPDVLFARIIAGEGFMAEARPYAADLLRRQLQGRFVPVLVRQPDVGGAPRHLLMIRRIFPGESPAALWSFWGEIQPPEPTGAP